MSRDTALARGLHVYSRGLDPEFEWTPGATE